MEANVRESREEGTEDCIDVCVSHVVPQVQKLSNTLFLWVCLYMIALDLGSDIFLRSLSVTDASAGARTSHTHSHKYKHTQED